MGKKNKNTKKNDEPTESAQSSKPASSSTQKKEEPGNKQQKGPQQGQGHQQQPIQRGGGDQKTTGQQTGGDQQSGSWRQQQRNPGQHQGGGDQRRDVQQQSGTRQHGEGDQQRGAWGQQQRNPGQQQAGGDQQRRDVQQQSGTRQHGGGDQQRGAWGQQQRNPGQQQAGGDQQRRDVQQQSGTRQHGGGDQQRGAWGQQQRNPGQQQAGGDQQRRDVQQQSGTRQHGGGDQQRGAWGQQQRNPGQQQAGGDQQRRDVQQQSGTRQHGGGDQQRGAWGQQQRNPGQQQAGGDQQRRDVQQQSGTRQQDRGGQQRGTWGREQSGGGAQQQGERYQQNRGGRQGGAGQQRGSSQGMIQQQQLGGGQQIQVENPLPVKATSCNGIVRGTLGAPGTVEVNYLRLNLDKMPDEAYHYDVTITPEKPKKFLRPAFEQFKAEMFPDIVLSFDGVRNCYALQRLKTPVECKVDVPDGGNRKKEFKIVLKETDTCVVDLKTLRNYQDERIFDKPMRALQVLEVVLASNNHERGLRVGRSFFRRPLDAFDLEDGYEAWTGLYQAAILGEMPLLNVDIAHKSFPCESKVLQYLDRYNVDKNKDLSASYSFKDICSFFNGIKIVYTPPAIFGSFAKEYVVLGVGEPAAVKKFKTDDGKEQTVANYFKSKGYTLNYPNLNCLKVGSTVKQISLPMELCTIPSGQALNRKDQSKQVERMVRYAATSTNRRKHKIMELLTYFNHNVNPIIQSFGLSIGSNFLKVPMRMLPSPCLEYFQGQTVRTFKGAWRMDNNKFLICSKPPNGHKWCILYEEVTRGRGISYHDLESFRTAVMKTSQSLNMNLQNNAEIKAYKFVQLQTTLRDLARDKYDLVFVVLNERGTPYAKIKQIAEIDIGILTQCIKEKTIFRTAKDRTVFSNILLKVNGKLNGTNHKIGLDRDSNLLAPLKNVMYLGADVTHPSPDQRQIPSVVGVAASHDAEGACYNCQYRLQRGTLENIEDMENIVSRHLEVYKKHQNKYPDIIIYYRDGVSDGQFPIVEREEIRAIRRACANMRCKIKLTCIIVVKRHHTRFFPLKQPEHDRDFNNVQAGTVVDQYITHPNEVQFFMVSHQSIQGTARPTRYNVIMDDLKLNINLLQKLTYNLCHLFPRCNRAVSYPAPAYLAHLVAFRGRVYIEGTQRFDTDLKREYDKRKIKPDFMNKNPMYFI